MSHFCAKDGCYNPKNNSVYCTVHLDEVLADAQYRAALARDIVEHDELQEDGVHTRLCGAVGAEGPTMLRSRCCALAEVGTNTCAAHRNA